MATFTQDAWDRVAGWRDAVQTMPFIRALADGSLPEPSFGFYLAQDAIYLTEFARALSATAAAAPDISAQSFFAGSAHEALQVESALHRDWLGRHGDPAPAVMSPVTAAYVDHLLATCVRDPYPVRVAALLPCYWLYADIGEVLLREACDLDRHPYQRWICTYAEPGFQDATQQACALADKAATETSAAIRNQMLAAFERSAMHEYLFFDQGTNRPAWPLPPGHAG